MSDNFPPVGSRCSVESRKTETSPEHIPRPGWAAASTARAAGKARPAANDSSVANPCLNCGACCAHFRVSFYCGEIADDSGAGMVPPELVSQVGPLRAAMKGTEQGRGRCVALRGEIGSPDVHCGIYEQRPSPCREFEPWQADGNPLPDCQRVRALFGLPPLPHLTDGGTGPDAEAA